MKTAPTYPWLLQEHPVPNTTYMKDKLGQLKTGTSFSEGKNWEQTV